MPTDSGLALHLRKRVAQVGVLVFVTSLLAPVVSVPFTLLGEEVGFGVTASYLLVAFAGLVLLVAALIPESSGESWGSMSPLVGYDNAIDSLYVRGPWRQRFQELDEQDAERRVRTAMGEWFQPQPD